MIIVFTTVAKEDDGKELARKLVEKRLAACVQILPRMHSVYSFEGEIKEEPEFLLQIKTKRGKYTALEKFIKENHKYEIPEIVAIESVEASPEYVGWLSNQLK